MIRLLDRHWLLTWTTFGTWLPGDRRGFVGPVPSAEGLIERHSAPGTLYDADMPQIHARAVSQMTEPSVRLTLAHAKAVIEQFQETANHRGWLLLAASVMATHMHLVVSVEGDPEPSTMMRDFKSYASRALNRSEGEAQRWWTESGSKRKLPDEPAVRAGVRYTLNQKRMLASFVHSEIPASWKS